jgi:hypothetical protein
VDYATIIAAVVTYFVAYAVLALGEALREYLNDKNQEGGGTSRLGARSGSGAGLCSRPPLNLTSRARASAGRIPD